MSEVILTGDHPDKAGKYRHLLPQIYALIEGETNQVANLANTASALKSAFNWWWVGFYLVEKDQLVLGPFQGPVACTRIAFGKGVCGTAWKERKTIVVSDVQLFPGHIACSAASRSEIVVPVLKHNEVIAVLDADSEHHSHFDETDHLFLEQLCSHLSSIL